MTYQMYHQRERGVAFYRSCSWYQTSFYGTICDVYIRVSRVEETIRRFTIEEISETKCVALGSSGVVGKEDR